MSIAALLLAAAVLFAGDADRPRLRIGLEAVRSAQRRPRGPLADPFTAASAFDVFAVCLAAGMPVCAAASASAPSAPPGLRAVLQRAADMLELGGDPQTAWAAPRDADDACQALMRLARRSANSGSALAHGVAELAQQSRQLATDAASAAAERAGVLIAGPLGLCFLPAFVCLGIVPVIAGLASDVFTGVLS